MPNIIFATNSTLIPGSLGYASVNSFRPIAKRNILTIPGVKFDSNANCSLTYGSQAFSSMLRVAKKYFSVDYVVYFDEDAFLLNPASLVKMLNEFIASGAVLGGPSDGGTCCHRPFSRVHVNLYLSFWNVKALAPYLGENMSASWSEVTEALAFGQISGIISEAEKHWQKWASKIDGDRLARLREANPSCRIDPGAFSEPSDEKEPYYLLENWILKKTGKPFWYVPTVDINVPDVDEGISSIVLYDKAPVVMHTWFARATVDSRFQDQRTRIEKVLSKFNLL